MVELNTYARSQKAKWQSKSKSKPGK